MRDCECRRSRRGLAYERVRAPGASDHGQGALHLVDILLRTRRRRHGGVTLKTVRAYLERAIGARHGFWTFSGSQLAKAARDGRTLAPRELSFAGHA